MKFCQYCGGQIDEKAVICVHCGRSVNSVEKKAVKEDDAPSFGIALLGFFFPIVGFILYAVFSDSPKKAKSALNGAIWGVVVSVVWGIVSAILSTVFEYMVYQSFLEIFEELMYEFI